RTEHGNYRVGNRVQRCTVLVEGLKKRPAITLRGHRGDQPQVTGCDQEASLVLSGAEFLKFLGREYLGNRHCKMKVLPPLSQSQGQKACGAAAAHGVSFQPDSSEFDQATKLL